MRVRKLKMMPHLARPDGVETRPGGSQGCLDCPLPASHPIHTLPETAEEVAEAERRRFGE